jgi:hypothetical protein
VATLCAAWVYSSTEGLRSVMHDGIDSARCTHSLHMLQMFKLDNSSFYLQKFQVDEVETSESGNNSLFGVGSRLKSFRNLVDSSSAGKASPMYSGFRISDHECPLGPP